MKSKLIGAIMVAFSLFGSNNSMASDDSNVSNAVLYNGKPTLESLVEVYSHRGGRGLVPENTMQAYRSSLRQGVDYVDMDVGVTKDGIVVVTHDLSLNPNITKKDGQFIEKPILINSLTYQELLEYDVGQLKPGTEYASFFPMQYSIEKVRIPTLQEVISYVKSLAGEKVGFQIEIKTNPEKPETTVSEEVFAQKVYDVIKTEGVIDRTEIQAFNFKCLLALQKLDPKVKTAYLTNTTTPKKDDREKLWHAGYDVKDYDNSYPKMVKALGGSAWEPFEIDLTKEKIDEAHNLGLKVVVWGWPEYEGTEFNYPKIVDLINWGIDGIITDRPDELRGILSARGYNLPQGFQVKEI